MHELNEIKGSLKRGDESFSFKQKPLEFKVSDFWSWSQSDLLNNTQRGVLAEYLIKQALGITTEIRTDWDPFDLVTEDGIKIEVKSSAYLQSWKQNDFSKISFDIAPKRAWDSKTNEFSSESNRHSDYYVFCLLHHKDQNSINPLNLDQWTFFVLPTKVLNSEIRQQKRIGLASLIRLQPKKCGFNELHKHIK